MVSELAAKSYKDRLKELGLTTLRSLRLDMLQTYKIVREHDRVKADTWSYLASDSPRLTRQKAGPMNLRPKASTLKFRQNFFSQKDVSERKQNIRRNKDSTKCGFFQKELHHTIVNGWSPKWRYTYPLGHVLKMVIFGSNNGLNFY
jgi:hypothetical protein